MTRPFWMGVVAMSVTAGALVASGCGGAGDHQATAPASQQQAIATRNVALAIDGMT